MNIRLLLVSVGSGGLREVSCGLHRPFCRTLRWNGWESPCVPVGLWPLRLACVVVPSRIHVGKKFRIESLFALIQA